MPQKCSVCVHAKRAHINKALLNPKWSLRDIAGQYGVSKSFLAHTGESFFRNIAERFEVANRFASPIPGDAQPQFGRFGLPATGSGHQCCGTDTNRSW